MVPGVHSFAPALDRKGHLMLFCLNCKGHSVHDFYRNTEDNFMSHQFESQKLNYLAETRCKKQHYAHHGKSGRLIPVFSCVFIHYIYCILPILSKLHQSKASSHLGQVSFSAAVHEVDTIPRGSSHVKMCRALLGSTRVEPLGCIENMEGSSSIIDAIRVCDLMCMI